MQPPPSKPGKPLTTSQKVGRFAEKAARTTVGVIQEGILTGGGSVAGAGLRGFAATKAGQAVSRGAAAAGRRIGKVFKFTKGLFIRGNPAKATGGGVPKKFIRSVEKTTRLETRGYRPGPGERTPEGYIESVVKKYGGEVTATRPSGVEIIRVGPRGKHGIVGPHTHPRFRNPLPGGSVREGVSQKAREVTGRDAAEVFRSVSSGTARTKGGK